MFGTIRHAIRRIGHYADPRTHFAQVQRFAAFQGRVAHQVVAAHQRAAHFFERQARKDYVKGMRFTESIVQVVTPVLAFVASLVPIFGAILGPLLAYAGSWIARLSSSVTLRSKGVTGNENSQRARGKQRRTLEYGLFGSMIGGIASLFGLTTAVAAAPATGGQTALMAADGSGVALNTSAAGGDAADAALDSILAADKASEAAALATQAEATAAEQIVAETINPSLKMVSTSGNFAAESLPTNTALAEAVAPAGAGLGSFFTKAGNAILDFATKVGPGIAQSYLGQKKASGSGVDLGAGIGAGGGGAEGTGATGSGGLMDDIAGLPLPIKLGFGALGAGLVYVALKKRKAA